MAAWGTEARSGCSERDFRKLQDGYAGYEVVDADRDEIGTVDTTCVNGLDRREYVAVSGGLAGFVPGTSSSVVPPGICTADNNRRAIQASTRKEAVKNFPSLTTSRETAPECEAQARNYYRPQGSRLGLLPTPGRAHNNLAQERLQYLLRRLPH